MKFSVKFLNKKSLDYLVRFLRSFGLDRVIMVERDEVDKIFCNYHICRKKTKLKQCPHCKKYFCKTCFNPKLPGRYTKDRDVTQIFIEHPEFEYEKNNHPCPDFYDYEKKRMEEEDKRYRDALKIALSKEKYPVKEEMEPINDEIDETDTEKGILHIGNKRVSLIGSEHSDGHDWYEWIYFFKTKKDAEWVFNQAKKKNKNIIENKEDDAYLDKIQLRKSAKIPSVAFIYNRDKKPKKETKKETITGEIKKSDKSPLIVLIAIILGIAFLYYYNQYVLDEEITLTEVEIEQPLFEEIPINISFTDYLNNINDYNNKAVTLTGFLSRGIEGSGGSGVYVEYIVDDFDNRITLLNLNEKQIDLFPKIGKLTEIYNVTGKFKRKYQGLDLEVVNIVKAERPVKLVERK